jgi:hypothetical protein
MFFIIMSVVFSDGHTRDMTDIASQRFPTYRACMASAAVRANAIASVGAHGRYLCMTPHESDAALARTAKVSF